MPFLLTGALAVPHPNVPDPVVTASRVHFGSFAGALKQVDLAGLLPLPAALLRRKRWQHLLFVTPEVIGNLAVVDLGYTTHAFVAAVDAQLRRTVWEGSWLGPPRSPLAFVNDYPNDGLKARFLHASLAEVSCGKEASKDGFEFSARAAGIPLLRPPLFLKAKLSTGSGAPLAVITPTEGRGVHVTQKWAGLPLTGQLKVGRQTYVLDGGFGALDYTQGLLPRRTRWRWAAAAGRLPDGTVVGLNLSEGINENALWLGGELIPLSRPRFIWNDVDLYEPWRIESEDGVVRLRFVPIHVRREDRNFGLVKSRFAQPLGFFEGTLQLSGRTVQVRELGGVTEDQDTLW